MFLDTSGQHACFARVLFVSYPSQIIFFRNFRFDNNAKLVDDKSSLFKSSTFLDWEEKVANKHLTKVEDPFTPLINKQKTNTLLKLRNRVLESIGVDQPEFFNDETRGQLIKSAAIKHNVTLQAVYKWLHRQFTFGLPISTFDKCGNRGKVRFEKKYGTSAVEKVVEGFRKHYMLVQENTFETAYRLTLPSLEHVEHSISLDTFKRIGYQSFNRYYVEAKKLGAYHEYKHMRTLKGRNTDDVTGPGQMFLVDWTRADFYLVSSNSRRAFSGRPHLYIVTDVFSRLIVGALLTYDDPSASTIRHALFIAFTDKVKYLESFGVQADPKDWPAATICKWLQADRGPADLMPKESEAFMQNLKIKIHNTQTKRPQNNGLAETLIGLVQKTLFQVTGGKGMVNHDAGDRLALDKRPEAWATLNLATRIVFDIISALNNRTISDYSLNYQQQQDCVDKIPIALWHHGYEKCLGFSKKIPEKQLWLMMLYSETRKADRIRGIEFYKKNYVPIEKEHFNLFQTLMHGKKREVLIAYDRCRLHELFWVHEGNFYPLRLKGENDAPFANIWDAGNINGYYAQNDQAGKAQDRANLNEIQENTTKYREQAEAVAPEANLKDSKQTRDEEKAKLKNESKSPVSDYFPNQITPEPHLSVEPTDDDNDILAEFYKDE